uniref:NADH dehydrogenase subunit 2 n=1 Tax=Caulerpa lentillifera TaxID=148947 RepID=A0A2Z2QKI7_9CHLO|nr:NADH dehydrogenase subunit 2 [Caulerpa lentillifera]AST24252.1 NADH dehydrogenase subunit 2 [Caulerpa lentillifera]QKS32218.1 NADH dehydrogenase subunit 2 [Caulerpa lentillifera]
MIDFFENDWNCLLPELFCVLTSVALVLFGAAYGMYVTNSHGVGVNQGVPLDIGIFMVRRRHSNAEPGLLCSGALGALILVYVCGLILHRPITQASCCASGFILDSLSSQCQLILVGAAFLSVFLSMNSMRQQALNGFECVCLMLFSTTGGMFLICSADLMSLFLSLEIQSVCFYVLAATARNSEFSTEAGLKYLVLGAFSSGVLLFGCSLLYGFCGTTSLYELANLSAVTWVDSITAPGGRIVSGVGLVFLLFGVLFKLGAAPFHNWVPDVYEGAPIGITTFFAAVPKVAIMAFMLRVSTQLCQMWPQMLTHRVKNTASCCLFSLFIGAIGALGQRKLKRLFAYGAIAHVGYLLMALCARNPEGVHWMFFYLTLYALLVLCGFGLLMCPARREWVFSYQGTCYLSELSTIMKTNPVLAMSFTITLFSMAGIPPLAGFLAKYFILLSAFNAKLYLIGFIGALVTVISCVEFLSGSGPAAC